MVMVPNLTGVMVMVMATGPTKVMVMVMVMVIVMATGPSINQPAHYQLSA